MPIMNGSNAVGKIYIGEKLIVSSGGDDGEKITGTATVALDDIRSEAVLDAKIEIAGTAAVILNNVQSESSFDMRIGIVGTATVENTEA